VVVDDEVHCSPVRGIRSGPVVHPEQVEALDQGGFQEVESFSYTISVPFSHEGWRGRIRTCNGIGSALSVEQVERFDAELAELLAPRVPRPAPGGPPGLRRERNQSLIPDRHRARHETGPPDGDRPPEGGLSRRGGAGSPTGPPPGRTTGPMDRYRRFG